MESASETKKTNAGAISSGWAGRSMGVCLPCCAAFSEGLSAMFSGVHTGPGATVHPDPFLYEILRQRFGESMDRSLSGSIVQQFFVALQPCDGTGIYNRAAGFQVR